MANNRPIGREKRVGGSGGGVHRGEATGTGPVGGGSGLGGSGGGRSSGSPQRSSGGGLLKYIIIAAVVLLGGGGGLGSVLLGGSSDTATTGGSTYQSSENTGNTGSSSASSSSTGSLLGSLLGGSSGYSGGASSSWTLTANTGQLDRTQAAGAREPYTTVRGDGSDKTTVMVYMCGTDLESKSGMATRDLQEMANATLYDNINVIVYTGGCKAWKNNIISSSKNQIYKVENGGLKLLEADMGSGAMTDPTNLSTFIKYAAANYPANRYDLIFWDHGGGSKSGYGYDEKYASAGSMSLSGIDEALSAGGVKYDFIGFDACLMATVETGLVTAKYADYLIASEETEPGVGWYYTTWLTKYSADPSMSTLDLGQIIIDSFTSACAQSCSGQKTTLSLIDLAELEVTVPSKLTAFAKDTSELIKNDNYKQVATARSNTREFATSSRIDQIDLVHLATQIGSEEGDALRDALLSAVKYNRVSSAMTNAYGISAYFPGQTRSNVSVSGVVSLYKSIGMDDEYTRCVQSYAEYQGAGQVASTGSLSGGTSSAGSQGGTSINGSDLISLFGMLSGASAGVSSYGNTDMLGSLITGFLGSDMSSLTGRSLAESGLDSEAVTEYISQNQFDPSALVWSEGGGSPYITLSEEQWSLVTDLELNMIYDDGYGYLNLGLDNVFDFDDDGNLLAPEDRTWLALDGNIVSYFHISTTGTDDDYEITGRVPVLYNGDYANLILVFTSDEPYGYIAGITFDYRDGETDTVAKNMTELSEGDELVFICDGFDYDGNYEDTYTLGEPYTVSGDMRDIEITNEDVGDGRVLQMYRFVDIYGCEYYTPVIGD